MDAQRSWKNVLIQSTLNILSWKSRNRYIIIESDDWGAIRMASRSSYNDFLSKGYPVDQCHYNRYDSLESNSDLLFLAEVLQKFKGCDNKPPIITMNNIVANPDFYRIKKSDYLQYFYKPFNLTLRDYPSSDKVLEIYKEGIQKKVFQIQLHGREHVNVRNWLKSLQNGVVPLLKAFDHKMYSVIHENDKSCSSQRLDALNICPPDYGNEVESYFKEGQRIFKEIWGFTSKSFIAPCYIWHPDFEIYMKKVGIKFVQGQRAQRIPSSLGLKRKYHYTGQASSSGIRYLIRNCTFEPSSNHHLDWVDSCLSDIENAFRFSNAAIIESHRVNYTGTLDERNRDRNLRQLGFLFSKILKRWPSVRFISTPEYGEKIVNNDS